MKQVILNSSRENTTLSMINKMQIIMQENENIYNTDVLKSNLCD